jgi:hypothetical protein
LLPAIEAIPQVRESMLYISLFASLYRSVHILAQPEHLF